MSVKRSSGTVPGLGSGDPNNWMSALFRRPSDETVHVDDQEFDGTIGGTAVTPTGTVTWTQSRGALSAVFDTIAINDVACRLYPITAGASPVTIETAIRFISSTDSTPVVGLMFSDGTPDSSGAVWFYTNMSSSGMTVRTGTITNMSVSETADDKANQNLSSHLYMRLVWTAASTFKVSVSPDGIGWTPWAWGTVTEAITPTHMGVGVSNWANTVKQAVSFEYLRVTDTDLSV